MAYAVHDHDLAGRGLNRGTIGLRTRWDFTKYFSAAPIEDHCLCKAAIRGKGTIVIQEYNVVHLLALNKLGSYFAAVEINRCDAVFTPDIKSPRRRIENRVIPKCV